MRITLPVAVMFVGLWTSPASGADRRIQVEPSETRGLIAALLDKSRKAEIQLKDGTKLSGTVIGVSAPGLLLEVKKRVQSVPYDQLVTIRLDLGPNRGWSAAGFALGFVGGYAATFGLIAGANSNRAAEWAIPIVLIGGPILGAKLAERRHREWLIVEVR